MAGELRVGIAGYGTVGRIRHRVGDAHPSFKVVGVCDERFGNDMEVLPEVDCFTSADILLEQELDVLMVCLPNYLAPNVTIAGLEAGLHVFCEKPPGRNIDDILRVMECEKRHPGQKLMYGFNHRYHDSVRDALRIIQSGDIGTIINMRGVYGKSKIISFDSDWRTERELAGGGILLDQGIHMVDMMRLFVGDFEEVHSFISNSFWQHDVEDNAYALMRTGDGKVAMLHSSATQWRHRFQLDIALTRGAISLSGILSGTRSYAPETITVIYVDESEPGDTREQTTLYTTDNSWQDEIFDFAKAILSDSRIESGSSTEALKTIELVYRIYSADRHWCNQFGLS